MRKPVTAFVVAAVLLAGCTSGEDSASNDTSTSVGTSDASTTVPTGPAPGVTDDSIKVGAVYIDFSAIQDVVDVDWGDYEGAYQALFDDINANGGINGRTIDATLVPLNPLDETSAEADCVQLTEDDPQFIILGFFTDDDVMCPLEAHPTAVIGGFMTPDRLERAQAPWFSLNPSGDFDEEVIRKLADAGDLDGTLGVFARTEQQAQMEDTVLPLLDELGIEVTDSAVVDTPRDDNTASNANTAIVAERFSSEGIDRVLTVGDGAIAWLNGVQGTDYRPRVLMTNGNPATAFLSTPGNDLSILEGAVSGNTYGGPQNVYELPGQQECTNTLEDAGVEVPEPATFDGDTEPYKGPFIVCNEVALLRALLEAAGPDLNYGTLTAGADGLEVQLPGDEAPSTFGPPPAADGDRPAYLFDWDTAENDFVLREGQ